MTPDSSTHDTAIIGSSPPALIAACEHLLDGENVAIIEAKPRLGGSWTSTSFAGHELDAGCYFLEPTRRGYRRLRNLDVPLHALAHGARMQLHPGSKMRQLNFDLAGGLLLIQSLFTRQPATGFRSRHFIGRVYHTLVKPALLLVKGTLRAVNPFRIKPQYTEGGASKIVQALVEKASALGATMYARDASRIDVNPEKCLIHTEEGIITAGRVVLTEGTRLEQLTVDGKTIPLVQASKPFHHLFLLIDQPPLGLDEYAHFFGHSAIHRYSYLGQGSHDGNPGHIIVVNLQREYVQKNGRTPESALTVLNSLKDIPLVPEGTRMIHHMWELREVSANFPPLLVRQLNRIPRISIIHSRSLTKSSKPRRGRNEGPPQGADNILDFQG